MERAMRGSKGQNLAKLVGSIGVSAGPGNNVLAILGGVAGGSLAFGGPGAVVLPAVGAVSKSLAERMARGNAKFLDDVIRSGRDGNRIVAAYVRNTRRAQRNPQELAQLLMQTDVDLSALRGTDDLVVEAASLARQTRNALQAATGAAGAGLQNPELEQLAPAQ